MKNLIATLITFVSFNIFANEKITDCVFLGTQSPTIKVSLFKDKTIRIFVDRSPNSNNTQWEELDSEYGYQAIKVSDFKVTLVKRADPLALGPSSTWGILKKTGKKMLLSSSDSEIGVRVNGTCSR